MRAPDPEQAGDAAAADVDQVLREQVLARFDRRPLAPEQRQVAGLAARSRKVAIEADQVVVGVAAGRGQEADLRARLARQVENELVEQRIAGLHREAAAAEADDLAHSSSSTRVNAGLPWRGIVRPPRPRVFIQMSRFRRAGLDAAAPQSTKRALIGGLAAAGPFPHPQVCLGRPEQGPHRGLAAGAPLHLGEQVGEQPVVGDAVGVQVEDPVAGALTGEGDLAVIGAERVGERVRGGVRARAGERREAPGVGPERDAEEVAAVAVAAEREQLRRQLRRLVGSRGDDPGLVQELAQLGRGPATAGPRVPGDQG